MECDCGTCADIYNEDREEDFIIERLSHIEEEIAYIKKILAHKRIKEEAMQKIKDDAEQEKEENTKNDVKKIIEEIESQLKKMEGNTTTTRIVYPYPKRHHIYPYGLTTWI